MSKQTSLSCFFKKPALVKNNENEIIEINSDEQEIDILVKSNKYYDLLLAQVIRVQK